MTRLPIFVRQSRGRPWAAYYWNAWPSRNAKNDPIRVRRDSHQSRRIKQFWWALRRRQIP